MPDTCCVGGCKSNYATTIRETGETVSVFSFPTEKRKLWIDRLPNIIQYSDSLRVCAKHWHKNYETISKKGHLRPANPPSVFNNVPDSFYIQQTKTPRETKKRKVDSEYRTQITYKKNNKKDLISKLDQLVRFCKKLDGLLFSEIENSIQLIQMSGIPPVHVFSVVIFSDYRVECYKYGSRYNLGLPGSINTEVVIFSDYRGINTEVELQFVTFSVDFRPN